MSVSRESSLWTWLNKVKPVFKKRLHMCRVENSVMRGMADVEGCLDGQQFWIELKCEARPAHPSTKIKPRFEPEQIPWLSRRIAAGGRAFVLLQVGQGHFASRYLLAPNACSVLETGLTEEELSRFALVDPKSKAKAIIELVVAGDMAL